MGFVKKQKETESGVRDEGEEHMGFVKKKQKKNGIGRT